MHVTTAWSIFAHSGQCQMQTFVVSVISAFIIYCSIIQGDHSPGKLGTWENLRVVTGQGKVRGKGIVRGNVFIVCGQSPEVLFLTKNMQERS